MESWGVALILGVVEGLTEFVPVSSTGHLIIASHLLGFVGEKAASFQVAIQFGAILAVLLLYWHRFTDLLPVSNNSTRFRCEGSNLAGWPGICRITAATLPALVVGFLTKDLIKTHLFTPWAVTVALAGGGVAMLIAERLLKRRTSKPLETVTVAQAIGVGLFQVLALWPGTSRSAATIVGGMIVGLDRKGSAEFSFLIAVPIMLVVECYELMKMGTLFSPQDATNFMIGFLVSFIVALMAVKTFILFLSKWTLVPFAWYRIIVAPIFFLLTSEMRL
jgi:undecaprenyl-diphosphatase